MKYKNKVVSWRSVSHLNLPEAAGFKAKLTGSFSDRDGWVENEGPNQVPVLDYTDDTSGVYSGDGLLLGTGANIDLTQGWNASQPPHTFIQTFNP